MSQSPADVISLPVGGGAVSGIGEKFSPDLHSGTGVFTIPLNLPDGRHGFGPTLNLVYSSASGNGAFGIGWRLDSPAIARKTSKGVPRYGSNDTFILGDQDLTSVGGDAGRQRYRPRKETEFARITYLPDAAGGSWTVEHRNGVVDVYGTPKPQDTAAWTDLAAIYRPGASAQGRRTFYPDESRTDHDSE